MPLEDFEVGDGDGCDDDEREVEVEDEEVEVIGGIEGNVRVGVDDARLQNCWSSFSSVRSSVGH